MQPSLLSMQLRAKLTAMYTLAAKPRSLVLRRFVKSLHYHETDFPFGLERIVPNGQAHLMVNLAQDEFRVYEGARCERVNRQGGAVLAGPHAQAVVIDTRQQHWLAAVEFRPGGAGPFFSVPMTEACDQVVHLPHLWNADGSLLRERLLEAPTPQAKLAVFEETLLQHLAPSHDPAIAYAVTALQYGVPVAEVASRLGLLPKAFVRRFANQVGITPKRFARVRRLQRVLRSLRTGVEIDWCALAAKHGYADQAHLVHEFRELADITPSAYKPQSSKRNNHIPIPIH